ncbi:polysaccharide biosynthesis/export family protein [candidate division KSB1 bacterium]
MKYKLFSIAFIILSLFWFGGGFSQIKTQLGKNILILKEEDKPKDKLKTRTVEFVLEEAIDPNTYIVGPGDLFYVNLWGEEEEGFEVSVMPEGNIIIPSIGSLMIDGFTLKEVNELIIEKANRFYSGMQMTISLADIRKFKVHATGEVNKRGSYNASPVDRVSQIILLAEGYTPWADKKNIEIKHLDGNTDVFNLLEFENRGDIENNPFVRSGDIIHVARIKLSRGMIFVSGNISNPGYSQFYENETIGDLIERINVMKETTDWEYSYIKRKAGSENDKLETIPLDFIGSMDTDNNPEKIILKNDDYIYLPKKINEVFVYGAVRQQGAFPYYSNMRSSDYAGLAGKTERAGRNESIKVYRKDLKKALRGGDVVIERGDKIEVPIKYIESAKDYLQFIGTFATVLIAAKAVGLIK